MKKVISSMVCLALIFSIGGVVDAHPGRTDSNGGHTCRTNCEKWGLEYGEYHYHNGGGTNSSSGSSSNSSSNTRTTTESISSPAKAPKYDPANVTVKVDEKTISFDQDPVSIENNTMVPMRDIFEALGATIKWESSTETVTGTKGETTIKLTIGQSFATKNGQTISLAHPAIIVNEKTMVPLRFVSESLGASVKWNESTRTIEITL